MKRTCAAVFAAVAMAGCSGASPVTPAISPLGAAGSRSTAAQGTPVRFVVVVPSNAPKAHFISPSTQSVTFALGGKTLLVMNVSASSPNCKGFPKGRRCSAQTNVPGGKQTLDVTAFDGARGTGNVLARGEVAVTVTPGQTQPVRVTLMGMPASVALSLQSPYPPAGNAATTGVTVTVLDADGNAIVGTYPAKIALRDLDPSGATKLSVTSVKSSADAVTLAYDGSPLHSAQLTAKTAGAPLAHASLDPTPTVVGDFTPPNINDSGRPLPVGVADLCLGPDGNMWVTGASSGAILKLEPNGKYTLYPLIGTEPVGISVGSDKNLWFAEEQVGKIGKATTAGVITSYKVPAPKGVQSQPAWTALGPDGRTWFIDQRIPHSILGAIATDGKIAEYVLPKGSFPVEMIAGPDGNLWLSDGGTNAIDKVSTAGKVLATYKLPTANASPWGIAVGPDKNIWFAEFNANMIARMTPAGKVTEFALPTGFSGPLNVAAGPDGNVWFTESGGGFWNNVGKIGYMSTDGTMVRDFVGFKNVASHVHNLAFDTRGNLWYTMFIFTISSTGEFAY